MLPGPFASTTGFVSSGSGVVSCGPSLDSAAVVVGAFVSPPELDDAAVVVSCATVLSLAAFVSAAVLSAAAVVYVALVATVAELLRLICAAFPR